MVDDTWYARKSIHGRVDTWPIPRQFFPGTRRLGTRSGPPPLYLPAHEGLGRPVRRWWASGILIDGCFYFLLFIIPCSSAFFSHPEPSTVTTSRPYGHPPETPGLQHHLSLSLYTAERQHLGPPLGSLDPRIGRLSPTDVERITASLLSPCLRAQARSGLWRGGRPSETMPDSLMLSGARCPGETKCAARRGCWRRDVGSDAC